MININKENAIQLNITKKRKKKKPNNNVIKINRLIFCKKKNYFICFWNKGIILASIWSFRF